MESNSNLKKEKTMEFRLATFQGNLRTVNKFLMKFDGP